MAFITCGPLLRLRPQINIANRSRAAWITLPVYYRNGYGVAKLRRNASLHSRSVMLATTEPPEYSEADEEELLSMELSEEDLAMCEEVARMGPTLNSIVLTGRLGADPEHKFVGDSLEVCKFPLAVNGEWDPDDEPDEDKTSWFDVEAWGSTAKFIQKSARKGMRVGISGTLGVNSWTGRDGEEREQPVVSASTFEILQSRWEPNEHSSKYEQTSNPNSKRNAQDLSLVERRNLEDLPF